MLGKQPTYFDSRVQRARCELSSKLGEGNGIEKSHLAKKLEIGRLCIVWYPDGNCCETCQRNMMKAYIAYIIVDGSVLAAFARRLTLQGNGACATGAFLRRAKQQQLAAIELARSEELFYTEQYNRLRLSGKLGSVVDTHPFERYFTYSGLPKLVLKQICIESGILPDRRIDFNRFAQCCRMIAHCQSSVVRRDLAVIRTMENGSDGLKRMLRESLVKAPFMRPNCVIAFGRHVSQSYLSCKAIVEGDWHFA